AQSRRRRRIDLSVRGQHNAVVAARGLGGDQTIGDIERDLMRIALGRAAKAAAARQLQPDEIATLYRLAALGADRLARDQRYLAGSPKPAAVAAARGVVDALEIAQHRHRH